MSRVVDPDKVWGEKALRGPLTDWRRWCDGQAHEFSRGVDDLLPAGTSVSSKRSSFRQWAKRQGLDMAKVHTAVPDDETLVIFVEPEAVKAVGWTVDEKVEAKVAEEHAREVLRARSPGKAGAYRPRGYT